MRALFVSDLHANLRLPFARVDDGNVSSDRLRDVLDVIGQVKTHAAEVNAGAVFILGDLFDQRSPDGATLVHTARALRGLATVVPVYVLPGNHDAIDRDGRMYNLQMYAELEVPGLHVLGHETIEITEGVMVHAVPWLPEVRATKRIRARERKLSQGDRHILVFHQGVKGALWDSGRRSDDGLDGLIGEAFALALTGHYHRPQEFESGRYLGAPLDFRHGDEEAKVRGFLDVDLAANVLEPKVIPTKYPRFHTVRVTLKDQDNLDEVVDFASRMEVPGIGYVRLVLEGSARTLDRNRKVIAEWRKHIDETGVIRRLKVDPRPTREQRQRLDVEPALSLREMVRRYVDEFGPEDLDLKILANQGAGFVEGL
jgi:DNA repair exonuclease SbcCD nuclease subunit